MTTRTKYLRYGVLCTSLAMLVACGSESLRVPTPERVPYDAARGREISQRSCGFMLGGALPIGMSDRYRRGYDALMAQAPRDYVTDIKVQEVLRYAFVGWRYCAIFEATAYPRSAQ
jgi:hypothetical protein